MKDDVKFVPWIKFNMKKAGGVEYEYFEDIDMQIDKTDVDIDGKAIEEIMSVVYRYQKNYNIEFFTKRIQV